MCVAPTMTDQFETVNSLEFGQQAMHPNPNPNPNPNPIPIPNPNPNPIPIPNPNPNPNLTPISSLALAPYP